MRKVNKEFKHRFAAYVIDENELIFGAKAYLERHFIVVLSEGWFNKINVN